MNRIFSLDSAGTSRYNQDIQKPPQGGNHMYKAIRLFNYKDGIGLEQDALRGV